MNDYEQETQEVALQDIIALLREAQKKAYSMTDCIQLDVAGCVQNDLECMDDIISNINYELKLMQELS